MDVVDDGRKFSEHQCFLVDFICQWNKLRRKEYCKIHNLDDKFTQFYALMENAIPF